MSNSHTMGTRRLVGVIAVIASLGSGACSGGESGGTHTGGEIGAAGGSAGTGDGTVEGGSRGANDNGTGGPSTNPGGVAAGSGGGGTAGASVSDAGDAPADDDGGAGTTMESVFDGTTLSGWLPSKGTGVGNAPGSWDVQDDALHCTGMVRGTLISKNDYGNFRLIFQVRQLPATGADNHYASVLIWGARPPPNDAIGGIQFGTPNGYYWDYRPGHNNSGAAYFTSTSGGLSRTAWAQCEILTNMATGVARMACCSLGTAKSCRAKEVLKFADPAAARKGPIALQAHSVGGHDEYKNITIEENPTVDDLITTK